MLHKLLWWMHQVGSIGLVEEVYAKLPFLPHPPATHAPIDVPSLHVGEDVQT